LSLKSTSELLTPYLEVTKLPDPIMARLRELEVLQKDAQRRNNEVTELRRELEDLRSRAEELRENLRTIEKIASAAALRTELLAKLTSNERKSDEVQKQLLARAESQAAATARLAQLLSELRVD
jgi:ABC-type Fe3+-citrate transport system substrate-binding protein